MSIERIIMKDIFPSKVDVWIAAVCLAGPVIALGVLLAGALTGKSGDILTTFVPVIAVIGLLVWILVSTNYRFVNTNLLVRCGPFRWKIPISEITSVTPTGSVLSSPALSLDRIRIEYGTSRREIMISPRDKEGFLAALENRLPAAGREIIKRKVL